MARDTLVEGSTLTAIADAIREKTETSDVMYPSEMAGKIRGISGGIPIPDPIVAGDAVVKTSDVTTATSSLSSWASSGIYITISKAGTYRFKYSLAKSNSGRQSGSRLHKNGNEISGTTYGLNTTSKNFDCSNDVECAAGDRIEIYYKGEKVSNVTSCTVTTLAACVDLDLSYFN